MPPKKRIGEGFPAADLPVDSKLLSATLAAPYVLPPDCVGEQAAEVAAFYRRLKPYASSPSYDLTGEATRVFGSPHQLFVADVVFKLDGLRPLGERADERAWDVGIGVKGGLQYVREHTGEDGTRTVTTRLLRPDAFSPQYLKAALDALFERAYVGARAPVRGRGTLPVRRVGAVPVLDVSRNPAPAATELGAENSGAPTPALAAPEGRRFRPRRAVLALAGVALAVAGAFARAPQPAADASPTRGALPPVPANAPAQPSGAHAEQSPPATLIQMDHHQGLDKRKPNDTASTVVEYLPAYNQARHEGTVAWLVQAVAAQQGVKLTAEQTHALIVDALRASVPGGKNASEQQLLAAAAHLGNKTPITVNLSLLQTFARQNSAGA